MSVFRNIVSWYIPVSPAGSVSLQPHTCHSSPSDVCSEPDSPSDHRCQSDYQPPPGGEREGGREAEN